MEGLEPGGGDHHTVQVYREEMKIFRFRLIFLNKPRKLLVDLGKVSKKWMDLSNVHL